MESCSQFQLFLMCLLSKCEAERAYTRQNLMHEQIRTLSVRDERFDDATVAPTCALAVLPLQLPPLGCLGLVPE